jgi:hypothetical protein
MVDFRALAAPFPPEEVSWRLGSTSREKMRGMALAYLDARAVMDRLDAVCGPDGWQCKYSHANGKTVCDIGIRCGDEWLYKADGAGDSDIEAEKGALSDAFKRAAVRGGVGRYLYTLESPWVEVEAFGNPQKPSYRIKRGAYKELDMVLRRATQAILNPQPPQRDGLKEARDDIARMQNAGEQPVTEFKSAGRLAAELWASNALEIIKTPGFDTLSFKDWKLQPCTNKGTKNNGQKLEELREKHPDLADKIDEAADKLRVAA